MDDSWLLLTVMFMSLNANTPTMETKETKTQRGLYIVIDEMANTLEYFGKNKEQKNEDSWKQQKTTEFAN